MIELVGWAIHQHYRTKKVPWIKQHTKSLNDPTYRCLSHGARSLLNDLWMLAGGTTDGWLRAFGGKPCSSLSLAWILREECAYVSAALLELAAVRDENDKPRWLILHGDYELGPCLESVKSESRLISAISCPEREGEGRGERESSVLRTGDEPRTVESPAEDSEKRLREERQASIGRLMGIVRKAAYLGREPKGYDPARDVSILRRWLQHGRSEEEIRTAIEGLRAAVEGGTVEWANPESGAQLKPGERFTLRALVNTKNGDRFTWDVATDTGLRAPAGPMLEPMRDILRKAAA